MTTRWCGSARIDLRLDEVAMAFRAVVRNGQARPYQTYVSVPLAGIDVTAPHMIDMAAESVVRSALKHGADVCAGFALTSCGHPDVWRKRYARGV